MKIIKKEIKPIGYCTIELTETEIQAIIYSIEEIQMIRNRPFDEIGGIRGEIYIELSKLLKSPNKDK